MQEGLLHYKIDRREHPPLTLYWIATSVQRGRPITLYELSCIFCKRTIMSDFQGEITAVINAPVNLVGFGMSATVQCKQCKQHYRLVVSN